MQAHTDTVLASATINTSDNELLSLQYFISRLAIKTLIYPSINTMSNFLFLKMPELNHQQVIQFNDIP